MGESCQGGLAICKPLTPSKLVEEILEQLVGSLEGCHRMFAATHLLFGFKTV